MIDLYRAIFGKRDAEEAEDARKVELFLTDRSMVVLTANRPLTVDHMERIKTTWEAALKRSGPVAFVLDDSLTLQIVERG